MLVKEKSDQDHNLYYHEYKNLSYNSEYSFAVRGANVVYFKESREQWFKFKTPSCMKALNDSQICAPEEIRKLSAEFSFVKGHTFNVKVTWKEMNLKPDFYTLVIKDVNPTRSKNDSMNVHQYTIRKVSDIKKFFFLIN